MKNYKKIIAIQANSIQKINVKTDTTVLLALEAQRRGYTIYYYETKNLTFSNKIVYAQVREIKFNEKEISKTLKLTENKLCLLTNKDNIISLGKFEDNYFKPKKVFI